MYSAYVYLGTSGFADLRIGSRQLAAGMSIHEFPAIPSLLPSKSVAVTLGINFNDTTQIAKFEVLQKFRKRQQKKAKLFLINAETNN